MKKRYLICICFLLVFLQTVHSRAIDVYWTEVPSNPAYIVVGTLVEMNRECFETPGFPHPSAGLSVMVHDCGWIEIEESLFGDCRAERIPVSWISYSRLKEHTLTKKEQRALSKHSWHNIGDRKIWVLWNINEREDSSTSYYEFQDLLVDSIGRVKEEIKEIE